jgi:hypothetical protein
LCFAATCAATPCLAALGDAKGANDNWLLECLAMKRYLRFVLVLLAAAMHLAAPVAAYARVMPAGMPGDFCSAARGASTTRFGQGYPPPSSEHHCAHAPCCAGGAADSAAAPPPVPVAFRVAQAGVPVPESMSVTAALAVIIAAQPRGPPVLS